MPFIEYQLAQGETSSSAIEPIRVREMCFSPGPNKTISSLDLVYENMPTLITAWFLSKMHLHSTSQIARSMRKSKQSPAVPTRTLAAFTGSLRLGALLSVHCVHS